MSWLPGWSYAKEISLTGQAGSGTYYQVELSIGDSAGGDFHLEGNCSNFPQDIAVTDNDGVTELDYWIEDLTSDPIVMHIKVDDDLGSNQTIWVYYGKSGATTKSNIGDTFLFGDDFLGSTLDTSKWDDITVGGSFSDDIANSILTLDASSFSSSPSNGEGIKSDVAIVNSPTIVQFRYRAQGTLNGQILQVHPTWAWDSFDSPVIYHRGDNNVHHEDIGGWQDDLYVRSRDTSWHTTEMRFTGTNLKYYEDGSLVGTGDESTTGITNNKIILGSWRWGGGGELEVDWVLVRKYNDPEPAFTSASSEHTAPPGILRNPSMGGGMS